MPVFVRTPRALVLPAVCVLLVGCSAIRVTQEDKKDHTKKLDGVPFYSMSALCKHETVWLGPTYDVSLSRVSRVKSGADYKEITTQLGTALLSLSMYNSQEFKILRKTLLDSTAAQSESKVIELFKGLLSNPYTLPGFLPQRKNRILASNQNAPEAFVNYSDRLFYNARRPVLGTVNASVELGANGTLTKGSAQIEDKTLQAVLDLLPVKSVLTTVAENALKKPVTGLAEEPEVALKLTIDPQIYKYSLSKLTEIAPNCTEAAFKLAGQKAEKAGRKADNPKPEDFLLQQITADVNFSRTTMSADDAKKKADDSKKVKFSGDVELPK